MTEPIERIHRPLKKMLWQNFLGGIIWSLGVTVGLTLVAAILGFALSRINLVPIIGDFVSGVTEFVEENRPKEVIQTIEEKQPPLPPTHPSTPIPSPSQLRQKN